MNLLNNNFSGNAISITPALQPDISTLIEIAASINDTPLSNSLNELPVKLASNRFYLVIVRLFKLRGIDILQYTYCKRTAPFCDLIYTPEFGSFFSHNSNTTLGGILP